MVHKIKVSDEYIESLCQWLDEWSSSDEALTIPQFLAQYGIPWKHLDQIMNHHPLVDSAFQIAAARLHSRWLQKAIDTKKLSRHLSGIMFRYLEVYDSHAFKVKIDARRQIADTTPVTLNVYEAEDYKNLPLQDGFKKLYDQNANKRRSSTEAE